MHFTTQQFEKIKTDLALIDLLTKKGKERGYRIVIAGGYAVDAAIGQITRYHDDIDVQVYFANVEERAIKDFLVDLITTIVPDASFVKEYGNDFWHCCVIQSGKTIIELYFIKLATDPFAKEKVVVKRNGSKTGLQRFETVQAEVGGVHFEAQSPRVELNDRIAKRERGEPRLDKHVSDIENLKKLLNAT